MAHTSSIPGGAPGSALSSSPVVADGRVYVGSNDGNLYAYAR